MATTITNTRIARTFDHTGENYALRGDYRTNEDGVITSLSANAYKGEEFLGSLNAFDYTEEGGLKVNLNQINLDDAQGIMAELTELMGEIRANG